MADIRTKLILDNANFNRNIDESTQRTNKFNSNLGKLGAIAITGAKAIAGLGVAINGLAYNQARLGAQLQDTSDKLGVSVEFLQEFRFAAEQVGVSSQTADMGLQRFIRRVQEASTGTGEAKDTLRALGIQLRDTNGQLKPTEQLIREVADAFANAEDKSLEVVRGFKLFDSEGLALINTLSKGSGELKRFADRADDLGIILNEQDTQTLKDLDDSFTELTLVVKALADEFVLGLAEALRVTNEEMIKMIANNQELARTLGAGVGEALRTTAAALEVVVQNITLIRDAFLTLIGVRLANNLQVSVASFNKLRKSIVDANGEAVSLTKVIGRKVAALALASAKFLAVAGVVYGLIRAFFALKNETIEVGDVTTSLGEIFDAVAFKIGQFFKQLLKFGPVLKTAFIDALDSAAPAFEGILEAIKTLVNSAINSFLLLPNTLRLVFDQMRRLVKGEQVNLVAEFQQMFQDMLDADYVGAAGEKISEIIANLVRDYRQAKDDLDDGPLRIEIETDNVGDEDQEAPGQNFSQYTTEFMAGWNQAFGDWKSEVEDTAKFGREVFNKFANGLTDTLTTFFMTGKADFRGFLQDILQMIIKSGIQRALAGIFSGLGGLGPEGGIFSSLFGGPRADGGPVSPNKSYLVGERGPEMFVPDSAGTIVPNEQLGASKQSGMQEQVTNNYITNNISAIDSKSVAQLFAENRQTLLGTVQLAQRETPF